MGNPSESYGASPALKCGIAQCYVPHDTGECAPP